MVNGDRTFGPSRFDLSVSGRPPAASEGAGPPSLKTKTSSKTAKISLRERHCAPLTSCSCMGMCADTLFKADPKRHPSTCSHLMLFVLPRAASLAPLGVFSTLSVGSCGPPGPLLFSVFQNARPPATLSAEAARPPTHQEIKTGRPYWYSPPEQSNGGKIYHDFEANPDRQNRQNTRYSPGIPGFSQVYPQNTRYFASLAEFGRKPASDSAQIPKN